jgi:hypothetical protein
MSDHKYTLHLTERQARVIIDALDLFSRIGMGQLKEVSYVLRQNPLPEPEAERDARITLLSDIRERLDMLSRYWNANGFSGITSKSISDRFRIAWDILQVIRHRLAWDQKPEGGITVDFDEPMVTAREFLPTISLVKTAKELTLSKEELAELELLKKIPITQPRAKRRSTEKK